MIKKKCLIHFGFASFFPFLWSIRSEQKDEKYVENNSQSGRICNYFFLFSQILLNNNNHFMQQFSISFISLVNVYTFLLKTNFFFILSFLPRSTTFVSETTFLRSALRWDFFEFQKKEIIEETKIEKSVTRNKLCTLNDMYKCLNYVFNWLNFANCHFPLPRIYAMQKLPNEI